MAEVAHGVILIAGESLCRCVMMVWVKLLVKLLYIVRCLNSYKRTRVMQVLSSASHFLIWKECVPTPSQICECTVQSSRLP